MTINTNILYNDILLLYNKFDDDNDIIIQYQTTDIPIKNLINTCSKSRFISNNTLSYLKNVIKVLIINYNNISFKVYYINEYDICISHLKKLIKRCVIISILNNINKNITINIILSPYKRFMPPINDNISYENINGGFTDTSSSTIFITRKEDFSKVVIHEVIHHCKNIDNPNWYIINILKLKNHFNISSNTLLIPNEAIVELFAIIYNSIFISIEYNIDLQYILNIEKQYALYLYHKIINKQGTKRWIENTNSYCYIVFKTIFLYYYNDIDNLNVNYLTNFLIINSKKLNNIIINKKFTKFIKKYKGINSLSLVLFGNF